VHRRYWLAKQAGLSAMSFMLAATAAGLATCPMEGFSDRLMGVARLEHSYIDEFFLDQDLDPHLKNGAVNLINLRFTLTDPGSSWEAAIWGRNLLDEEYFAFGIDIPVLGGYAGVRAPGEVYGMTLRLRQ